MDTLTLQGLHYRGRHGYYEEEREKSNRFEVDLIFTLDLKPAGRQDDLSQTVNYEEAEAMVRQIMEGPSVKLIETLTVTIGDALFEKFNRVQQLEVRIRKVDPPLKTPANYSEVTMKWQR